MSEFSWLFWLLIIFLFAESWARAWANHREAQPPAPPQDCAPTDPC
ncbi:MAG: hypothetical protein JSV86_16710 [Gemmatimonadota bacterium]|nr:MAG: hypothetical protein JSV86_16710 [Gemmatimonadota bacterium]